MGEKKSMTTNILTILNVIYVIAGFAVTAFGIWFFVELYQFLELRNVNHYYLNYRVYWVQVIPWLFMFTGLFLMIVAMCGICSTKTNKRGLLMTYLVCLVINTVFFGLLSAGVFVFVDSESTDKFLTDTIWDGFYNAQSHPDIQSRFGVIETRYHCCGVTEPRDYRKIRSDFPPSCCYEASDYYSDVTQRTCDFTSKANDRHGCSIVVSLYARIFMKYVAVGSVLIGLLELIGVFVALHRYRRPQKKTLDLIRETESKKVLL